jgi:hypothetical protein
MSAGDTFGEHGIRLLLGIEFDSSFRIHSLFHTTPPPRIIFCAPSLASVFMGLIFSRLDSGPCDRPLLSVRGPSSYFSHPFAQLSI